MAITPTTTIVSTQSGLSRFFVKQIGNDLIDDWGSSYPSIYQNGDDWYAIFFHITNFGALTDNQLWSISIFKWDGVSWARQDAANDPLVVNPSLHNTKGYTNCLAATQVGTVIYIPHWNSSGFLAMARFDMATDTYGSLNTSTLTPGTNATVAAAAAGATGGMTANYVANLDLVYVFADGFSIPISGQDVQRPAYVRFHVTGDSWDLSFTIIGSDSSQPLPQASYGAAGADCKDALGVGIWQMDESGRTSKILFQNIYSDNSVSVVQDTGVAIPTPGGFPGNIACPLGKLVCTGTEYVIPYANSYLFGSYYSELNVVRTTVPSTNILPSSWTIEAVHSLDSSYRLAIGSTLVRDGDDLILVYVLDGAILGNGKKIACAVWSSGTWTDGATLSSSLTVLFARGALESTAPLVTYDFTATATDALGVNETSGVNNQIFAFVSLVEPSCNVPITLEFNLTGVLPVNGPSPAPPFTNPTECINQD